MDAKTGKTNRAKARQGKKAVVGYFSPDMNSALHAIGDAERVTIQHLVGEALDMLLRSRGREPLAER